MPGTVDDRHRRIARRVDRGSRSAGVRGSAPASRCRRAPTSPGSYLLSDLPLDQSRSGAACFDDLGEEPGPLPRPGRHAVPVRPASPLRVSKTKSAGSIGRSAPISVTGSRPPTDAHRDIQLGLDLGRELGNEDVPRGSSIKQPEARSRGSDGADRMPRPPSVLARAAELAAIAARRRPCADPPRASTARRPGRSRGRRADRRPRSDRPRSRSMPSCGRDRPQSGLGRGVARARAVPVSGRPGQLDRSIAGGGNRAGACPARSTRGERPDRVELERDLVESHGVTIRQSRRLSTVDPLGIGIVGTGNIAGGYARDILTHPGDPSGGGHGSRCRPGCAPSARSIGCTAHATARASCWPTRPSTSWST